MINSEGETTTRRGGSHAATIRNEKPLTVEELQTFLGNLKKACRQLDFGYTIGESQFIDALPIEGGRYILTSLPTNMSELKDMRDRFVGQTKKDYKGSITPEVLEALSKAYDNAVNEFETNRGKSPSVGGHYAMA